MNYKKYPKYKNSGIAWLGEIPEHWKIKKVKQQFEVTRGRVIPNTDLIENGLFPVYSSQTKNNGLLGKINSYDFEGEYISWTTDGVYAGTTFVRKGKFNATNICGLLKSRTYENIDFLGYLFSHITPPNKRPDTNGAKIMSNEMKNIFFILPPIPEQTTIANFLDYKLEKIDRFITKKKQLIELLNEKKAAIINQAVTKGLNLNAKMKPSGIEWLGDIPESWEVRKLKSITSIISKGTTPNTIGKSLIDDGSVKFLKAENIGFDNKVNENPINFIDEETNALLKRSQLQKYDILFVIAGASIGKVAILSEIFIPSNTNQAVSFIRLTDLQNVKFVWFWLQSEVIKQIMWLEAVQSAQPNLAMGKLANFPILLPSLNEQKAIVTHIETETAKIDQTITTIEKEIALVEEYKTALIAEAVTGKIDVRKWSETLIKKD